MTAERKTDQELVDTLRDKMADYVVMQASNLANVMPASVRKWFRTQWAVTDDALLTRLSELRAENETRGKSWQALRDRLEAIHQIGSGRNLTEYGEGAQEAYQNVMAWMDQYAALTTPTEDQGNG